MAKAASIFRTISIFLIILSTPSTPSSWPFLK
jgi:hypothetical protein